jgi:hypothetical protein
MKLPLRRTLVLFIAMMHLQTKSGKDGEAFIRDTDEHATIIEQNIE